MNKLSKGFLKTKKSLRERFKEIFTGAIDDDLYEDLIESLVLSDVPFLTAEEIVENAKEQLSKSEKSNEDDVRNAVAQSALNLLKNRANANPIRTPAIILVSGVNGVGKTTTIAKLANIFKKEGKKVLLAAADTFRAAASEQLSIWAQRLDIPIVKSEEGQDSSSVLFDAIKSATAKDIDIILCDTAGRLQSKKNLMSELEKIYRVAEKNRGGYELYSFLILDAMSGQNSIVQLESFSEIRTPDGIVLTKTDSSAKGGVLLGIASRTDVPIRYVGTGEGVDDIAEFDASSFIDAILG